MKFRSLVQIILCMSSFAGALESLARNSVRVASFEGGGMRGRLSSRVLEIAEERWNGNTQDFFDVLGGTSTGAIQACLGVFPDPETGRVSSAKEMGAFYEKYGPTIFTKRRAATGPKYKTRPFRRLLEKRFGNAKLSDVREGLELVLTAYDVERRLPKIFKSREARLDPRDDFFIVDLLEAATAAPTYFKAAKIRSVAAHQKMHEHLGGAGRGESLHRYSRAEFRKAMKRSQGANRLLLSERDTFHLVDGAVYANNPVLAAFEEAHNIFPEPFENYTVLSIGTGYSRKNINPERLQNAGILPWIKLFSNQMIGVLGQATQHCLETFVPRRSGNEVHSLRVNLEIQEGPTKIDVTSREHLDAWVRMVDNALGPDGTRGDLAELREDFYKIIQRIKDQTIVLSNREVEGRVSSPLTPSSPGGIPLPGMHVDPSLDNIAGADDSSSESSVLLGMPPAPAVKPVRVFSGDGGGYHALMTAHMIQILVEQIEEIDKSVDEELLPPRVGGALHLVVPSDGLPPIERSAPGPSAQPLLPPPLSPIIRPSARSGLPQKFHELFDYHVVTDTNAFLVCALLMSGDVPGVPQYTPAEVAEIFETRGSEMYAHKTCSFARPFIGPKCHHAPLDGLLEEIFGDKTLADLVGDVMIPLYDLGGGAHDRGSGEMVLMQSVKARQDPKYNFYLKDVVRAAMAVPGYFKIPKIKNVSGDKEYIFVSGSIFANNPSLLGLAEAYRLAPHGDLSRFILASFGTGGHHRRLPFETMEHAGRMTWADKIMSVMMDGSSTLTQWSAHSLVHKPSLVPQDYRLQPHTAVVDDAVDNTSENATKDLLDGVDGYFRQNKTTIDQLIRALRYKLVRADAAILRGVAMLQEPLRRHEHGLSLPPSEQVSRQVSPRQWSPLSFNSVDSRPNANQEITSGF